MFDGCGFSHTGISHDDKIAVGTVSAPAPGIHDHQSAAGILGKVVSLSVIKPAAGKGKAAYKSGDWYNLLQDTLNPGIGGKRRGDVPEALFLQVGDHPHLTFHDAHHALRTTAHFLESLFILGDGHDRHAHQPYGLALPVNLHNDLLPVIGSLFRPLSG